MRDTTGCSCLSSNYANWGANSIIGRQIRACLSFRGAHHGTYTFQVFFILKTLLTWHFFEVQVCLIPLFSILYPAPSVFLPFLPSSFSSHVLPPFRTFSCPLHFFPRLFFFFLPPPPSVSHCHRPIDEQNIGRKMLKNMGWKGEGGLGKTEDGIAEPVRMPLPTQNFLAFL